MNIIHVLRAPVGGLFRHVIDLASGQVARGHRVGLIADSQTGDARADEILGVLAPHLALGVSRIPMRRQPGPGDAFGVWHVARRLRAARADVVHGHGAKGGALARLAPVSGKIVRAYTPHGGSLHGAVAGRIHILLERMLMRRGNLYLFESAFAHDAFHRKIGSPPGVTRIVHNGVRPAEFEPAAACATACDLVFLGELRPLKGVDVLIDALHQLRSAGRAATAAIVGDGPGAAALRTQAERLGITDAIRFCPPTPARAAFALGRIVVMPSRAESLPYVALEAAAAGKPLIATRVGGIPEIFGPLGGALVTAGDAGALAQAIAAMLDDPEGAHQTAQALRTRVADGFSVDVMVEAVLSAYELAMTALQRNSGGHPSAKKGMSPLWRAAP
jgi:glycosyltransferase involved in cell wall biosynthesis